MYGWSIPCHDRCFSERNAATVEDDVIGLVHIVDDLLCLGLKVTPAGSAEAIELRMGEIHRLLSRGIDFCLSPFDIKVLVWLDLAWNLERVLCDLIASRLTQVVAVQMHRHRESETLINLAQTLYDLS